MSYNETGQYLATVHEGERAVYTWANKVLFVAHINIRAHPADYLPSWSMISTEEGGTCDIDDDEDDLTTLMDQDIKAMKELQIDENLVTFSGLPSSRWANLPDLALIKERNKPTDAVKKIKQAPFFLSASATLDGFEFETENIGDEMDGDSRYITSKRNLLELESSFTTLLRKLVVSGSSRASQLPNVRFFPEFDLKSVGVLHVEKWILQFLFEICIFSAESK